MDLDNGPDVFFEAHFARNLLGRAIGKPVFGFAAF